LSAIFILPFAEVVVAAAAAASVKRGMEARRIELLTPKPLRGIMKLFWTLRGAASNNDVRDFTLSWAFPKLILYVHGLSLRDDPRHEKHSLFSLSRSKQASKLARTKASALLI